MPDYLSPEARDVLAGLLQRDPTKRFGSGAGDAAEIKAHSFFREVDWVALHACRVTPPFAPQVQGSMDTNQFDSEFTNMPIVSPSSLKDAPVAQPMGSAAQQFAGFTYVAPYQLMAHGAARRGLGPFDHSPTSQASLAALSHGQMMAAALASQQNTGSVAGATAAARQTHPVQQLQGPADAVHNTDIEM